MSAGATDKQVYRIVYRRMYWFVWKLWQEAKVPARYHAKCAVYGHAPEPGQNQPAPATKRGFRIWSSHGHMSNGGSVISFYVDLIDANGKTTTYWDFNEGWKKIKEEFGVPSPAVATA